MTLARWTRGAPIDARTGLSLGRLRAVLRQQRLEPRVVADRIPARVEPQRVNGEQARLRQHAFDLVERCVGVTDLSEDLGANFRQARAANGVLARHGRLLQPPSLLQRFVTTPEPGQRLAAGRVDAEVVRPFLDRGVQKLYGRDR